MYGQVKLSLPPTSETDSYAESYLQALKNPPSPPKILTWADILAEEPFEGEHWEGVYGLPASSVRKSRRDDDGSSRSGDSTPSLSPLNSDDLELNEDDSFSSADYDTDELPPPLPSSTTNLFVPIETKPPHTFAHRKVFEDLQAKQYWRDDWRSDVDVGKPFDLGDASTLGVYLMKLFVLVLQSIVYFRTSAAKRSCP